MSSAEHKHVLIVEDELFVGLHVGLLFEELGYKSVALASSAVDAASQCRLKCPDLVTLDLQLLGGDGAHAARLIHEICGPVPVIFVTGSPHLVPIPQATVVDKPLTAGALARAIVIAESRIG